jgi:hypothetical protein
MADFNARVDSQVTCEITSTSATFTIELSNLPPVVTERMRGRMDHISEAILRALFGEVGGTKVDDLEIRSSHIVHTDTPGNNTRN